MPESAPTTSLGTASTPDAEERAAFLAAARRQTSRDRTLCETLHYTGCRPSELVEITPARVGLSGGAVTIRSLKKRRDASGAPRVVYRSVPVPPDYLDTLGSRPRSPAAPRPPAGRSAAADLPAHPHPRLADRQARHGRGRPPRRPAALPQGPAPRLRRPRRRLRRAPQHAPEVARPRAALHHRDLRRRRGQGGTGHRAEDVVGAGHPGARRPPEIRDMHGARQPPKSVFQGATGLSLKCRVLGGLTPC